jgi:hypothetical protein
MAEVTRLGLYGGPRSPYGSFAGKTPGEVIVAATGRRGGGGKAKSYKFVELYDRYAVSRTTQQQQLQVAKEAARAIEDKTDREIARLLHKQMEKEARDKEIDELKAVMEAARQEDLRMYNEAVAGAYVRAMEAQTFSTIEAFERQMDMAREEEEFLLLAMAVLH